MQGHGEKMTRKQEQAISALLTSPTMTEAAKEADISPVTLWRWLQLPEFQESYRLARREVVSQAIASLQQASGEAVASLRSIMQDEEAPTSARVTAAKAVLEFSIKAVELDDMESRIVALERIVSEGGIPR